MFVLIGSHSLPSLLDIFLGVLKGHTDSVWPGQLQGFVQLPEEQFRGD